MDVFIHEDYVNKRNMVRREQKKKTQVQVLQLGSTGACRPALARARGEGIPGTPRQCLTPTSLSPSSTIESPASGSSEEAVSSDHRRLFDCLKPY
ncbi:putative protein phosphatase 2C 39 [Hordeum vulgare]|uniref:uncharacterized protein LOC123426608 n=1 Tax=Hordeum vulgare subsp. vulgare TaxID=112509 RepID=UPI001D1A4150|nr:uncharacterized protein LOC123426608 [Hordeum vulgare subsp. vulgare]KAE8770042.1 putative protein phosphatase 2C 39 [Hordeum vulgare]KAI5015441.1 hypothetical protein ZWY2020_056831 [Hordeum vulgare]